LGFVTGEEISRVMLKRSTIGVALAALCLALLIDLFGVRGRAAAGLMLQPQDTFRIVSPSDEALVGDGNLVLIQGLADDRLDGVVDRIEVAIDDSDVWATVQTSADDPTQWSYLWSDPPPGTHRIRARAYGFEGQEMVEKVASVQVADVWRSPFIISNPYAAAGQFRKGQLHCHSTNSFDGWESLPPGAFALEYKRRGYQFVAITDHDVVSHPSEIEDRSFITFPAYESTSDTGHITGLLVTQPASPSASAQDRLEHITSQGGMAILNHPSWQVGWTGTNLRELQKYFAIELFNGMTANSPSAERNVGLWHEILNARGYGGRIWAVSVDDAHRVSEIDQGWVMVKSPELTDASIRTAMEKGAFYASNGPSFNTLGVLDGAIMASSPDAATIRFIDQDRQILKQGPAAGASYRPTGQERWVRIEAVTADGKTAWSQPFWLIPNAPNASVTDQAVVGKTVPWARVHIFAQDRYIGNTVANGLGEFWYAVGDLAHEELRLQVTAPWPDQVAGPTLVLSPS
jgi:hypothetical protein